MPGYKGGTATAGWFTFDLPGSGNFYFWDNVEVALNLTVSGTTATLPTIASYAIAPRADNAYSCGNSTNRWSAVWAANGTIQTSDGNDKESIEDLIPAKAFEFITGMKPKKYQWRDNKEKHLGFIAQEIKQLLTDTGLPNNGLIYEPQSDDDKYGMNYTSLIPILISAFKYLVEQLQ